MRIVLDTNILVRAAADEAGLAGRLLGGIVAGPHVLISSAYILSEVARVLVYPRLQARWCLDRDQIAEFETRLAAVAEIVRTVPIPRIVPGDPNDDPIVQTAITGRADVLCTRDSHLLDPAVVQYCSRQGVRIIDDIELYRILTAEG
jgi:uncharacterized protein